MLKNHLRGVAHLGSSQIFIFVQRIVVAAEAVAQGVSRPGRDLRGIGQRRKSRPPFPPRRRYKPVAFALGGEPGGKIIGASLRLGVPRPLPGC